MEYYPEVTQRTDILICALPQVEIDRYPCLYLQAKDSFEQAEKYLILLCTSQLTVDFGETKIVESFKVFWKLIMHGSFYQMISGIRRSCWSAVHFMIVSVLLLAFLATIYCSATFPALSSSSFSARVLLQFSHTFALTLTLIDVWNVSISVRV
jgi:hypothetical protein